MRYGSRPRQFRVVRPLGAGGPQGAQRPQAEGGADTDRETKGGVDANATKEHLRDVARRLDVPGRSSMTKDELVDAIRRADDRATAKAREE